MLAGVAYLWWQSRLPSHYSEWTKDLAAEGVDRLAESRFDQPEALAWTFKSTGDSSLQVARLSDSLVRYRVELFCGDSLLLHLRLDFNPGGTLRTLTLNSSRKQLQVIPSGDSARFIARGDSVTDSWIPWSPQALLFEAIPALCDSWQLRDSSHSQEVTLVRIQPQTEVVVQLPARLSGSGDGATVLQTSGKDLVRITYDSATGVAATIWQAGGRVWQRGPSGLGRKK
jgi:hypothetical protein